MRLVAGAYPCYFPEPDATAEFLAALGADDRFGALELPIRGLDDPLTWPDGAPDDWAAVVTQIPGTMGMMARDPQVGLASTAIRGRTDAIEFARHTFERVNALKDAGHPVIAVELHSAPRGWCEPTALAESLSHIGKWAWGDTWLVLEHCDAPRPGIEPQKGFLELAEEIDVITRLRDTLDTRLGITINWARSVIETRSVHAGLAHVVQAREAGVLAGMMFSSVSPEETSFGHPWIDAHLAPVGVPGAPSSSLLTPELLDDCLDALPTDLLYLGAKVGLEHIDSPKRRAAAWSAVVDLVRARETGAAEAAPVRDQ